MSYGALNPKDPDVTAILSQVKNLKKGRDVFPLIKDLMATGKLPAADPGIKAASKKGFIADLQSGNFKSLVAKFHVVKRSIQATADQALGGWVEDAIQAVGKAALAAGKWASDEDNRKAVSIFTGDLKSIKTIRKAAKDADAAAKAADNIASQPGNSQQIRDPRTGQIVTIESARLKAAKQKAAKAARDAKKAERTSDLGVDPALIVGGVAVTAAAVYFLARR